jgi:putative Ca2+/H+ antiporter (TMEM165/GDT1 family)
VDPLPAFLLSLGLIFVAELGDKTPLVAIMLARHHRPLLVLAAMGGTAFVVNVGAVVLGGVVGRIVPDQLLHGIAGIAFLLIAFRALGESALDDEERARIERDARSLWLAAGSAFLLAELGDKTMYATVTLALTEDLIGTLLGATAAVVAADAFAIAVAGRSAPRLALQAFRVVSAVVLGAFGVLLLSDALGYRLV